jgi:hypothetical protein
LLSFITTQPLLLRILNRRLLIKVLKRVGFSRLRLNIAQTRKAY